MNRPNIVFIVLDQWRGDCLGAAQSRHPVMTPHFNQLAAEGVRFRRAYADCPVCMPQRVTMLTGQGASRFGMPHNFAQGVRTPINVETSLPRRLTREAGYQTKAIGKMHFQPDRARFGFEHITLHPDDYVNWLEDRGYGGMYRGHGLGGNEVYPAVYPIPEQYTHSAWVIDESIRFLGQRDPDNPFFLWMIFEAPHSPFDPPQPYDRLYDQFSIPDPVYGDWYETDYPAIFRERRLTHKYDQLNADMLRAARRHYYAQITHIDYQLGRFLGELRTRGLYDDTLIVATADHGECLGDHGIFAKSVYLESSACVPLIMRGPAIPAVVESNAPVLTADIPATLLDAAGLDPWPDVEGISLLPHLRNETALDDRIICGESIGTAFATDGQYKYIYFTKGGREQLFEVANDPDDLHNLAADPAYRPQLNHLKSRLIEYLSSFERPMVRDGALVVEDEHIDETQLRSRNPAAWRGPLRWGQGYGGT